jgi:hypothetical protein
MTQSLRCMCVQVLQYRADYGVSSKRSCEGLLLLLDSGETLKPWFWHFCA